MDQFQLKQIVSEAIAKHAKPGQPGSDPAALASEIAREHHLEDTAEIEKMIHDMAAEKGLKFVRPIPPS